MVFKGTERRPGKERIAEEVRSLGGSLNAGTYYEDTNYYITVPAGRIGDAIAIQADMLQNPRIDSGELAKELEVIIQESKQKRDNPSAMLLETLYATAYDRHRIRRWRIGEDEVLRSLMRDDLTEFMRGSYGPENIVICVAGDVEPESILDEIGRNWNAIPQSGLGLDDSPAEDRPRDFRYHRMTGDIQQKLLVFGFHAPDILSADAPALVVLDALLSDGRSSRLYRNVKEERGLASSVWANYEGFRKLGVITIGAEVPDSDPLAAETALLEEAAKIVRDPISSEELERVKTRVESRRLFAQEEVLGVARTLAWYEALGDYRRFDDFLDRIRQVEAPDIVRVSAEYLNFDDATLVEYLPASTDAPSRTTDAIASELIAAKPVVRGHSVHRSLDKSVPELIHLPTGASLVYKHRGDLPIVALHVLFTGGRSGETSNNSGVTNLMLRSSLKGTAKLTAPEIAARIEGLGSGIGLSLSPDYFGFSIKILADRFSEGLEVLRDVIANPKFEGSELEKEKISILAEIRRIRDSMTARASELFYQACFGNAPYGLPASGNPESLAGMDSPMLQGWHDGSISGSGAVFGVVGSIDRNELLDLLSSLLPHRAKELPVRTSTFVTPRIEEDSSDRQQTASMLGFAGAAIGNVDRHALDLLSEITSGMAGRFFKAVRGDNALAYSVTSFHRSRKDAGIFGVYTSTSPDNEESAREIILEECRRLARMPVGGEELRDAKEAIRGEYAINTQTFSAQAGELAVNQLYGLPLDEPDLYLTHIDRLDAENLLEAARRYLTTDHYWQGIVRGTSTS
jgi:zinc protease